MLITSTPWKKGRTILVWGITSIDNITFKSVGTMRNFFLAPPLVRPSCLLRMFLFFCKAAHRKHLKKRVRTNRLFSPVDKNQKEHKPLLLIIPHFYKIMLNIFMFWFEIILQIFYVSCFQMFQLSCIKEQARNLNNSKYKLL